MQATKAIGQPHADGTLAALLDDCLVLTYNAIHYAEEKGIRNRKGMKGFYRSTKAISLPSCYKVAVITRACAVLESRRKSEKRGVPVRHPKPLRPMVCITSGFFITAKGRLFILIQRDRYVDIQLDRYVVNRLGGKKLRSLTMTRTSLSFCISDEVEAIPVRTVYGVDRNEKNLTFGDEEGVSQLDMSKTVRIRQTTREVVGSFKRNDARTRRKLARKYWRRATHRTDQMLHAATNLVVKNAMENGAALALENLSGIRKLYRKGNGQGVDYRFRLNSWPYGKAYRILEYKAAWNGVTLISLTKAETHGSSSVHYACGERLRRPAKGDAVHARRLWCEACNVWVDRDVNAAVVLSTRGLARFASSLPRPRGGLQQLPEAGEKGLAGEAMKGDPTKPVILRVDASKLSGGHDPTFCRRGRDPST